MNEASLRDRPIIQIRNLSKVYFMGEERVIALKNINLSINRGEICCIFGTSGSGKSTLLNQLAGLEKPTRGDVFIGGKNISRMTENQLAAFRQRHLGFVFQSYNLLKELTAVENVAMPLMFRGVPYEKRIREAEKYMKLIGIGDQGEHMPNQMSGGQQQRVGIARALVIDPKIIFADEPTGNLDSHTTEDVLRLLQKIVREEDRTLIMVTHDAHIASWADRQLRVVDGKIVETVIRPDSPIEQKIETETGNPPFAQVTPLG